MIRPSVLCGLGLGLAVLAGAAPVGADEDEAAVMFELLFAPDVRKVKATPGVEDDLALARQLVKAAAGDRDWATIEVLTDNAYDLSHRTPKGYDIAAEAMETMKQHVPDRAEECDENILVIRRKLYAAARPATRTAAGGALLRALTNVADRKIARGDPAEAAKLLRQAVLVAGSVQRDRLGALQAKRKTCDAAVQAERQIQVCKAKLRTAPDDRQAKARLVQLYLVDRDDPVAAAAYLTPDSDEVLRTYVPLAAKKPGDLAAQACGELGAWYYGLSETASAAAKPAMLRRALGYFRGQVDKLDGSGAEVAKARLRIAQIEQKLKE